MRFRGKYYIEAGICDKALLVSKLIMLVMHYGGRSMQKEIQRKVS